jgi:polysaccharide pyruvyl transferase WcaK-like protein
MSSIGSGYKVCLFGVSLDTGNLGVSALTASLIKIILEIRPDAEISLLIGNRSSSPQELEVLGQMRQINVVNYRLSPRARIQEHLVWILTIALLQKVLPFRKIKQKLINSNRWLRTLAQADFIGDIFAGDSFSDIYGLWRLIIGSIPSMIALLLEKNLVLLPQTYGPYKSIVAKTIARLILVHSECILSRDKESLEVVRKLIVRHIGKKDVALCPDIAFVLESSFHNKLNTQLYPDLRPDTFLIGFNINGLMYNGGYTRNNMFGLKCDYKLFAQQLIFRMMEETPADILLIPHNFSPRGNVESDYDACDGVLQSVAKEYRDRVHITIGEYDQYEIKAIIALCDFFIGSRMHACIAALSQGIPTVGIAYSKKFKGLFETIGVGEMVIDARFVDIEEAVEAVFKNYKDRERIARIIQENVSNAKQKIKDSFKEIMIN